MRTDKLSFRVMATTHQIDIEAEVAFVPIEKGGRKTRELFWLGGCGFLSSHILDWILSMKTRNQSPRSHPPLPLRLQLKYKIKVVGVYMMT